MGCFGVSDDDEEESLLYGIRADESLGGMKANPWGVMLLLVVSLVVSTNDDESLYGIRASWWGAVVLSVSFLASIKCCCWWWWGGAGYD